ncbi:MAG: hypothetical protein C7B46_15160 [Sulfobacillus benefaciens]|uniref:Arsenate reductase n=1 Tax=Sulfobacillus benefaciens TaxID=453960 RepID=A0A2T2XCL1_9FIRM|nr:MAG: hypothetical protein C7B46_15160 [Sulfobacillus benefaciens]
MEFLERDLINDPLTTAEIVSIREEVGDLIPLISKKSPKYRELKHEDLTEQQWIREMSQEPRLIKRPLWRVNGHLYVGFDPETWAKALIT